MVRDPLQFRPDALPERYPYRDDGCEVAPACLQCPLPRCKYDEPRLILRFRRDHRDQEVIQAWRTDHLSIAALAQRFNLSTRTITRALQRARHEPGLDEAMGDAADTQVAEHALAAPQLVLVNTASKKPQAMAANVPHAPRAAAGG